MQFNITDLPPEILVYIFSLLPPESKNCLSRTCKRFHALLQSSYAWPVVDLTAFPRVCGSHMTSGTASGPPSPYDSRLSGYLRALSRIEPRVQTLRLCIDSVDLHRHIEDLEPFLHSMSGRCLRVAHLNIGSASRNHDCDQDRVYLLRRRKRAYQHFLCYFSKAAGGSASHPSALKHLLLAYDWTEAAYRHLADFTQLETLVLQRYNFVDSHFSQHALQKVPYLLYLLYYFHANAVSPCVRVKETIIK